MVFLFDNLKECQTPQDSACLPWKWKSSRPKPLDGQRDRANCPHTDKGLMGERCCPSIMDALCPHKGGSALEHPRAEPQPAWVSWLQVTDNGPTDGRMTQEVHLGSSQGPAVTQEPPPQPESPLRHSRLRAGYQLCTELPTSKCQCASASLQHLPWLSATFG